VDGQSPGREVLLVPIQHPDTRTPVQELPSVAMPAETLWAAVLKETRKLPGQTPRTRSRELLADKRCSQGVLVFLATEDV